MSESSKRRSNDFLEISGQFKLGALVTEASHPVTANLSEVARKDPTAALGLLFQADEDVLKKFRAVVQSGRIESMAATVLAAIKNGGRFFFTGCGSTGRLSILLDSVWRDFWRQHGNQDTENRTFSVMAGGDFALIKSVEGFEDFTEFGKKQITDLNVSSRDVVFAITEGGETSFVIGTAWAGVAAGAKVYFVYNNPDEVLCEHVARSREVIQDARIEKVNLTTGPMAITGSTRMQATSIQLCVLLTVLEIVSHELIGTSGKDAPANFLAALEELFATLHSPEFRGQLAQLVTLEEKIYRANHKNNYHANRLAIDVLTDTTERSPTFCTPPFRKFDDAAAAESWSFLFLPNDWTDTAWENLLKRKPRCLEWTREEVFALVGEEKVERTLETIHKISPTELLRYKIGINGLKYREQFGCDSTIAVISRKEDCEIHWKQLEHAHEIGAQTGQIYFGHLSSAESAQQIKTRVPGCVSVFMPLPEAPFLLDGVAHVATKLVMNALSTCTMVRLGRVMGNYMVWVVPSNLKLIDRATRYISQLAGLDYAAANELLFEVIEYIEPRMKLDQAYPPAVGMAVLRAKDHLTNEQAEEKLKATASE
jgi:N-acetylmuramic acid 6-phosphate etherase